MNYFLIDKNDSYDDNEFYSFPMKMSIVIDNKIDNNIDLYYLNKLEEYNAIFGQQQIENISSTLNLMSFGTKNDKLEVYKKNNVYKCIQWCEKYNIPHNKSQPTQNIFMRQV